MIYGNLKAIDVDSYIATFSPEIQQALHDVRAAIKETAPEAEEFISYAMPAYRLHKQQLVYFAAFKNHIGFYALPSGNEEFQKELSRYKTGKGSIQFPLNQPMPLDLIKQIVRFRMQENLEKLRAKRNNGKAT